MLKDDAFAAPVLASITLIAATIVGTIFVLNADEEYRATNDGREQRLFSDCMEDRKEYECEALLR